MLQVTQYLANETDVSIIFGRPHRFTAQIFSGNVAHSAVIYVIGGLVLPPPPPRDGSLFLGTISARRSSCYRHHFADVNNIF
jgi:hypothetical protein